MEGNLKYAFIVVKVASLITECRELLATSFWSCHCSSCPLLKKETVSCASGQGAEPDSWCNWRLGSLSAASSRHRPKSWAFFSLQVYRAHLARTYRRRSRCDRYQVSRHLRYAWNSKPHSTFPKWAQHSQEQACWRARLAIGRGVVR